MAFFAAIGLYLWGLFKLWLTALFIAPWQHKDMLWLLIPIWATWFFAEFFQEKRGTSMGNAITNAVVILWGSVDCSRQTLKLYSQGALAGVGSLIARFALIGILISYGVTIVVLGLKGNKLIKYIGRIREVTYAFVIFTPVFYNKMDFTLNHVIAALIFFPLFYFVIELIDRYTPNPKAVQEDIEDKDESPSSSFGSSSNSSDSLGGLGGEKKDSGGLDDFKL